MHGHYLDIELLKQSFDAYLKQPLSDNEKKNTFFEYPIDVLEKLLILYQTGERYEVCQLINNVLAVKTVPVGTILNYDELQAIYDNAEHIEFKNQLKAVLVSVKIYSEMHGIPLANFSFMKSDTGSINVKEIREGGKI